MKGLSRQVSPGAAVFFVVVVLAIVQWVWWRGLVYKPPATPTGPAPGGPPRTAEQIMLPGHTYVKVETYSGDVEPGDADGPAYAARFDRPTGIALDGTGKLYVCDTGNNIIRTVAADGGVTTLAGGEQGFQDGPTSSARFNAPCGICLAPDGTVYVADTGNARIRQVKNGLVSTLAVFKEASAPVNIAYVPGARPLLVVTNASRGNLEYYDTKGSMVGSRPHPDSVVITETDLEPSAEIHAVKTAPVPIDGSDVMADVARRPALRHLVGWCRIGSSALATDSGHAAVFLLKHGSAEVLAGVASSAGPMLGYRDGTGDKALFYTLTSVVTDGVKYAYVADTGSNCIRRFTIPDFLFH